MIVIFYHIVIEYTAFKWHWQSKEIVSVFTQFNDDLYWYRKVFDTLQSIIPLNKISFSYRNHEAVCTFLVLKILHGNLPLGYQKLQAKHPVPTIIVKSLTSCSVLLVNGQPTLHPEGSNHGITVLDCFHLQCLLSPHLT